MTYQQQAYQYIKSNILSMKLKPGAYITDAQISSELNISRTPVREAFRRLEKEGLLVNETHRGWKVYTLSLDDIHEIFELKIAIEGMAAYKAAECSDAVLRGRLISTLQQMETAANAKDLQSWMAGDAILHDTIYALAGNGRAKDIVQTLNDQWQRVRAGFIARTGRLERSYTEHSEIIEAILSGDPERAERTMKNHLARLKDELVNILVTMVLPFASEGI